ncbi:LysR family transcriptional regulator [Amycolatopsis sp. lyj-23]|uniref:LysR family transcriptional regulator n=1 Tax=Amycolatopsis sp. lyj-23 TaxID=2789283 RepID=UPI00397D157F
MVELRHLRYFTAVVDERHFSRAAARLYVTQSTLSAQIRQLEAEIGGPLLIRSSRSVELTESGRVFDAEARRILDQADRAVHVARQLVLGEAGSLRIGFAGVAAFSGVLSLDMRAFRRRHPAVALDVVELSPAAVLEQLHAGSIELGYTPNLDLTPDDDTVSTFRRAIKLSAGLFEEHPLARNPVVTSADLIDETLILPASPQDDGNLLLDKLRPPGHSGPVRFVPSTLGVLTLAAAGIGAAVVPLDLEPVPIPGLVHRPIADVSGPDLIVVSRRGETLGPVLAYLRALEVPEERSRVPSSGP